MQVGSLVTLHPRGVGEGKLLYTEPAVHRAEVVGRFSSEEVGLVLEVRPHAGGLVGFARLFCPRGTGWINTVFLAEVAPPY